ncbi:MAG: DUF4926 domain-containing protein [Hyphomicrobiaceae bacterium]|nr:MAG: DUF4926 domain-containing protein [Hyphomicrobiaceae bacterium]
MQPIKLHDVVALTSDLPVHALKRGDLGTVVHVYPDDVGYEIEFVTLGGETIAVVTLPSGAVRKTGSREIAHVRDVA